MFTRPLARSSGEVATVFTPPVPAFLRRGLAQQVGDLEARIQAAAKEELQALVAEQDAARQWLQNLERRARDAVLRSVSPPPRGLFSPRMNVRLPRNVIRFCCCVDWGP